MRTIKFRGKTIDGTWIIGDFVRPNVILEDKDTNLSLGKLYLNNSSIVIQDSVGQFTGLFDEDGREIYEGDIIKIVEEFDDENVYTRNGVVCFEEGIYELQDKNGKHFAYLGWLMHDDAITKLEVIGNIHDNPELIEKGGEQ